MNKCQFCGSEKTRIETPYLVHGEKSYSYCCMAQKRNAEYIEHHVSRWSDEKLDPEKVSRW